MADGESMRGSPMSRVHLPVSEAKTVRQVALADGVERSYRYPALLNLRVIATDLKRVGNTPNCCKEKDYVDVTQDTA